jgi:hypothetical protein
MPPYALLIAYLPMPCLQVSYMILQRVSPVTHSIGNCLKRVIVIVASVIFFQNPMGRQNMIGAQLHPAWKTPSSVVILPFLIFMRDHCRTPT